MLNRSLPLAALTLSAFAALPLRAAADVLLVDGQGGPGAFLGIQGAVLSASDGDTILVKEGEYPEFEVAGKSVTILAEQGADVRIVPTFASEPIPLVVRDLAADQAVVVRGIRLLPDVLGPLEPAVQLLDNLGAVLLEDVHVETFPGWASLALLVENCAAVVLTRCSFRAGFCIEPCPGGELIDSSVTLYDTQLFGADGLPTGLFLPAGPGGAGLAVSGGRVFAAGCTFQGGSGGPSGPEECNAEAGDGLVLGAGAPTVTVRDTLLAPGLPGTGGLSDPPCADLEGQPLVVVSGAFQELAGDARSLVASAPVREGEALALTFGGTPGELAFLAFSNALAPSFLPPVAGDFVLAKPFGIVFSGELDASGTLADSVPVGELGPGVLALPVQLQAIHLTGLGGAFVGAPSSTVLLDGAL
ncbi:MAG: hypothetical protein AAF682_29425 [Planctomycetota bacterium]